MEFHGTARVIELDAPQFPWNALETARVGEIGAPQVPKFIVNLDLLIWMQIIFDFAG